MNEGADMFINRILFITMGFLLTSCTHVVQAKQRGPENFPRVILHTVYDGDTFYVDIPYCDIAVFCSHIPVRVRGVDCPEMKGGTAATKARAQQAKAFTRGFLSNSKISLQNCTRDKYFRLLCDVVVNNKSLAQELIKNGHGIPYHGGTKTK